MRMSRRSEMTFDSLTQRTFGEVNLILSRKSHIIGSNDHQLLLLEFLLCNIYNVLIIIIAVRLHNNFTII